MRVCRAEDAYSGVVRLLAESNSLVYLRQGVQGLNSPAPDWIRRQV
eukprot:COSAG04_NODE_231_length_19199_cov_263.690209_18_plen_46_part_00